MNIFFLKLFETKMKIVVNSFVAQVIAGTSTHVIIEQPNKWRI